MNTMNHRDRQYAQRGLDHKETQLDPETLREYREEMQAVEQRDTANRAHHAARLDPLQQSDTLFEAERQPYAKTGQPHIDARQQSYPGVGADPRQTPPYQHYSTGQTNGRFGEGQPSYTDNRNQDAPRQQKKQYLRQTGKVREPFTVVYLCIITFGIYGLVWLYKVAREINQYLGREQIPVWLVYLSIICFPLTYVLFYQIDEAIYIIDQAEGRPPKKKFPLWIFLSLIVIGWFVAVGQIQDKLNLIWNQRNARTSGMLLR